VRKNHAKQSFIAWSAWSGISASISEIETTSVEILFPKQAQAACHRKGSHYRENGVAGVGFDGFKEVLDGLSHVNVSLRSRDARAAFEHAARSIPATETMPRRARSSGGLSADKQALDSRVWGTNIA
jgi:hypothetical protein